MLPSGVTRLFCLATAAVLFLAGCSTNSPLRSTSGAAAKGISGSIHGGQQPISGVSLQLYTVGTSGDGSAATPLLTSSVLSDANGDFNITGLYTCPSATAPVYIAGTGGSPAPGITNPQIALMAAIGPCGSLSASTFLNINEITTVAAVYALAPFMSSLSAIGSGSSDAPALASAFTYAGYFANTSTGETPGLNLPPNYAVPIAQINTIADLLAACINSPGGVSGDTSICGTFFALTLPPGAPASTNAVAALLDLANNPTLNTAALYNLIPPVSPFQPTQPIVPPDLALRLLAGSAFVVSPSALTFTSATLGFTQPTQIVTVTNGTSAAVNITSASITGVSASDFALVPQPGSDCAITIPANATCTFQISFTPSASGARDAYLVLTNTSANPSIAIALAGIGVPGSAGPVSLTPATLTFTQLGIPQTLTLTNSGSSPLSINAINLSSTAYTQTNDCGSSLPAASSCSIDVSVPGPLTAASATLTVVDDAAGGPQTASLNFSGNAGASFPPLVDFGHWAIGATGTQFLEIGGPGVYGTFNLTITGPNAADFSFDANSSVLASTCNYENRFEEHCDLTLYYKPTALTTSTAYVNIAGVGRFTLTGTGDPAGVDFDFSQIYIFPIYAAAYRYLQPRQHPNRHPGVQLLRHPQYRHRIPARPQRARHLRPQRRRVHRHRALLRLRLLPINHLHTHGRRSPLSHPHLHRQHGPVTRTLTLTGTATAPVPVLTSPHTLLGSGVPVGTVSASQTITVIVFQNHPIQASIIPINSGGPQPFIFTGPTFCAATPCTLSIAYAPTAATGSTTNVYDVATDKSASPAETSRHRRGRARRLRRLRPAGTWSFPSRL